MKINTALILCAGFGKRLNPLTLKTPKPLLKLKNVTMLESCINTIIKLGIKKIHLNTFYLEDQIFDFIKKKNFPVNIQIYKDGEKILNTGGGVLNMIKDSSDNDYLIFNPDTLWNENYVNDINKMQNFYFQKNLDNILLLTNKVSSFDKKLKGDFDLKDNLINNNNRNFIYIGCQILNKKVFKNYQISNFSVLEIWNKLKETNKLNGFESLNKFYHLTDLETFKKLEDF
jgi:N-acetyl-alpha-D-muramate 1-phosphate uridylyltransferase